MMNFLQLDPLIRRALEEDLGRGDVTTDAILSHRAPIQGRARVIAKEPLVLAGWPLFCRVFQLLGQVEAHVNAAEGDWTEPGEIGELIGAGALLLRGERVALNLFQRTCGIATQTRRLVDRIAHTRTRLLDTRKTTPLWRSVEKYAVRTGGGANHRFGLDDAVLIKENHIALAGGIEAAIEACRQRAGHLHKIEIEVRDREELERALVAGADVIMLDNFTPQQVEEAVKLVSGRCALEVSGGINESTILEYAEAGADYLSMGALTHSVKAADISMLIETSHRI